MWVVCPPARRRTREREEREEEISGKKRGVSRLKRGGKRGRTCSKGRQGQGLNPRRAVSRTVASEVQLAGSWSLFLPIRRSIKRSGFPKVWSSGLILLLVHNPLPPRSQEPPQKLTSESPPHCSSGRSSLDLLPGTHHTLSFTHLHVHPPANPLFTILLNSLLEEEYKHHQKPFHTLQPVNLNLCGIYSPFPWILAISKSIPSWNPSLSLEESFTFLVSINHLNHLSFSVVVACIRAET
ncbi:uncharacterized protein LOC124882484 [Girardinichthys multiradiatus]|uniref:uncharacterized protein LOC124882484 n=1 Tax=Girardinichthys multiradiatus TaxID=208333 RepID=UPI001FAC9EA7|nr:uncharacterized protein LOC124882484 [Girardinichthys multiradiatus]